MFIIIVCDSKASLKESGIPMRMVKKHMARLTAEPLEDWLLCRKMTKMETTSKLNKAYMGTCLRINKHVGEAWMWICVHISRESNRNLLWLHWWGRIRAFFSRIFFLEFFPMILINLQWAEIHFGLFSLGFIF